MFLWTRMGVCYIKPCRQGSRVSIPNPVHQKVPIAVADNFP